MYSRIENDLVSEIKLDPIQAKVYLLVTCYGKMSSTKIAEKLKISLNDAQKAAKELITLGAFLTFLKLSLRQCILDLLQLTCIERCVSEKISNLNKIKLLIIWELF